MPRIKRLGSDVPLPNYQNPPQDPVPMGNPADPYANQQRSPSTGQVGYNPATYMQTPNPITQN